MAKAPARSLDGLYSVRQLAVATGLTRQRMSTLIKLGAIDPQRLTWRDAIAVRALIASGFTTDASTKALSAVDRQILDTVRQVLRETPDQADLTLLIQGEQVEPQPDLSMAALAASAKARTQPTSAVHLLPIGAWAAALRSNLETAAAAPTTTPSAEAAA